MKLQTLIRGLPVLEIRGDPDPEVSGLCSDSRKFQAGQIFVAIKGLQHDGHRFLSKAAQTGATALVVEDRESIPDNFTGTTIVVKESRHALDKMAANYFGHPSDAVFMVGVTGTNGKTTTTYMIEAILNKGVGPTGVIGTIDYHLGTDVKSSKHTTPDALDLQETLEGWRKSGAKAVAMEVSSHALSQGRADSVSFDAAVFTNLTRDHLDFHGTMEEYRLAKAYLFSHLLEGSKKKSKRAVINLDDEAAKYMMPPHVPTWTFGFDHGDVSAENLKLGFDGSTFDVKTPMGKFSGCLQMVGRHNVANALAAIGVGLHAGLPFTMISQALEQLTGVRGRLQRVTSKSEVRCFVDYAHTDDALLNVLNFIHTLRNQTSPKARIVTVFGCGGDRDKGKRPLMLKAAQKYSDLIVVTSDNPRTENPSQIIKDILSESAGSPAKNTLVEIDRRKAIELALEKALPGDVVLIAGKGHEDYQILGTEKIPFDDVKIAKEILDS